jgi:hypothetical protein
MTITEPILLALFASACFGLALVMTQFGLRYVQAGCGREHSDNGDPVLGIVSLFARREGLATPGCGDLRFCRLVLSSDRDAADVRGRRQLLWIEVTRHPTAEWLARQITEAFPWTSAPAYLVRDNDGAYGHVFTGEGHGYPRPADLAWIAVVKWLCGTPDRHIASRVPGPNADLSRVAPAASSCLIYGVLRSGAHALGITGRCALASSN